MPKTRKRMARNWAKNFAAGLLQNAEPQFQEGTGLTEEEIDVAQQELYRLAERIQSMVKNDLLPISED